MGGEGTGRVSCCQRVESMTICLSPRLRKARLGFSSRASLARKWGREEGTGAPLMPNAEDSGEELELVTWALLVCTRVVSMVKVILLYRSEPGKTCCSQAWLWESPCSGFERRGASRGGERRDKFVFFH